VSSDAPLILASASPRRAELLRQAGFAFTVAHADLDETPRAGEAPEVYVRRLAEAKAAAVAAGHPAAVVLGADTTVVVDGDIVGKPADAAEAAAMLARLQGRDHDVLTGVAVIGPAGQESAVARTRVWFAVMTPAEVAAYVATGEPMGKAGAYAIQGWASRYVTRLDGSYPNVVGLPVALVHELLGRYPRQGRKESAVRPPR
jgi:septum formation protein